MRKDTISQSLHIGWRIYFGFTFALQLFAIISFVLIRIIIVNADYTDARVVANHTANLLSISILVLVVLGIANTVAAIASYRRHVLTKTWRRILIIIATVSIGTLLIIVGVTANYFIERSTAVQQIHSDNINGKFLPLTQPKSQE